MKLGPITVTRKTGSEPFQDSGRELPFDLQGFWQWSGSDLLSNVWRGVLAEYLVACDLGVNEGTRVEWNAYDLKTKSGVTVEVKSAAYLQSWNQEKYSSILFDIRQTQGWDAETNEYSEERKRQADVYVFCLLAHKDKATVDPLDASQWRFFVLPTSKLNEALGDQKKLSFSTLMALSPQEAAFGEIGKAIEGLPGRHTEA